MNDLFDFDLDTSFEDDENYNPSEDKNYIFTKYKEVPRKLKKAIKVYQKDLYNWISYKKVTNNHRKSKLGRYVEYVMDMEYEYFYIACGDVRSKMVFDSDKHYIIADLVRGKRPWSFYY